MATRREQAQVDVILNGQKANASIKEMETYANRLRMELRGMATNTKEFTDKSRELSKVNARLKEIKTGGQQVNSVMQRLKGLLPVVSIAALGYGLKSLFSSMIRVRSEFEKYAAVLKNTLGSQEAANKEMQRLQDFAATTPFQLNELTGSYVKLVNQGFKPTTQEMTKLGDLAASQGKSFDQLTEAIIDAQVGEMERLKEFGVRAQKEGDQIKFTFKGVETQVDYTAESIRNYILSLGEAEGVSGGMAEISKTLGGRISNLKDSWDKFLNTLGSKTSGIFVTVIGWLTSMLELLGYTRKTLDDIRKTVMDETTQKNVAAAVDEINIMTQSLIKNGIEASKAKERAVELYYESIDRTIASTQEKLNKATGDEKKNIEKRLAMLRNEREGVILNYQEIERAEEMARVKRLQKEAEERAKKQKELEKQAKEEKKKLDERLKLAEEILEIAQTEELNKLKEDYVNRLITEEEYIFQSNQLEIAHLLARKALYEQFGLEIASVDEKILDVKIKILEREIDAEKKAAEEKKEAEEKKREELKKTEEEEKKRAEALQAQKKMEIESSFMAGEAAVENAATLQEAAVNVLNSIRQQIQAYISKAVAGAVAETVASIPFPFNIVLGTAAGAAVKLLLDRIIPKFDIGGYTGPGAKYQPAGVVHKGEYVVASEELAQPDVQKFIRTKIEPSRMRRLNSSAVHKAIRFDRGYAEGGPVTSTSQIPAQPAFDISIINNLIKTNNNLNIAIESLIIQLKNGVEAKVTDYTVDKITQRQANISKIRSSVSS